MKIRKMYHFQMRHEIYNKLKTTRKIKHFKTQQIPLFCRSVHSVLLNCDGYAKWAKCTVMLGIMAICQRSLTLPQHYVTACLKMVEISKHTMQVSKSDLAMDRSLYADSERGNY